MVMRSRRDSYDGDFGDDFGSGMDEPVPRHEPAPEAGPTANEAPADPGRVQDNADFRGLDRETQRWIEGQSDPFSALFQVMNGAGGPEQGGGGGGEQPTPEAPSTPPGPATPQPGPGGGGGAPDFVATPNETGQTFDSSFAQPGSVGARPFMSSERLNLFRSLPQFRELSGGGGAGGTRFSPEMSVGGGVGGNIGSDFGSLSSAFGQGRPGEDDFRRRMMGRMYSG